MCVCVCVCVEARISIRTCFIKKSPFHRINNPKSLNDRFKRKVQTGRIIAFPEVCKYLHLINYWYNMGTYCKTNSSSLRSMHLKIRRILRKVDVLCLSIRNTLQIEVILLTWNYNFTFLRDTIWCFSVILV